MIIIVVIVLLNDTPDHQIAFKKIIYLKSIIP